VTIMPSNSVRWPYFLTKAFATQSKSVVKFTWNHPANEQARMRALIRLAQFQARGRFLRRPTLARLGERSAIWAHLHRHASMKVVCANPPDHPEMLVWQRSLRSADLFVDVGANIGSYVVWAGELGAEVIALEPAKDTFMLLGRNVALNGYPVELIQAAAGAYCGTARFTAGRDTVNRVHPEGEIATKVVTIDSVIGSRTVHGMKVDVEGFEIEVLRGCMQALSDQRIKLIQLEWNASSLKAVGADRQPVVELLARFGYKLYRPDSSGRLLPVRDLTFGPDVFARPD
jgi:FkbM family methyltransferase